MPLFAPMLSAVDTWVALSMIGALLGGLLCEMRWSREPRSERTANGSGRGRRD